MPNYSEKSQNIVGKYKHYKGKYYTVYCVARDYQYGEYVLYQQIYGDKSFWVRPYNNFFETVRNEDGKEVKRFEKSNSKNKTCDSNIGQLIDFILDQTISIHDSENEEECRIIDISKDRDYVTICHIKRYSSCGYLSDFELMRRLGFLSCRINGEMRYFKNKDTIGTLERLEIGKNELDNLVKKINPCSIDLQIADSGYLCTKKKLIDPLSVETISTAEDLWEPVRVYKSKNNSTEYIKIKPGHTILTHIKEKIRIPNDCAAKIEIKSTFARLSLDITPGDFCNPGYYGHFPLEITNKGTHTIIIHKGETMAQLMLVPIQGPILERYSDRGTFINENGYDDGTPYTFWRERSIKSLRKEAGTEQIIDLYNKVLKTMTADNTKDINEAKERFSNNFLPFCQKRIFDSKYHDKDTSNPDAKKLLNAYRKKERFLHDLVYVKYGSIASFIISIINSFVLEYTTNLFGKGNETKNIKDILNENKSWTILSAVSLFIIIILSFQRQKTFCTLENIDIDAL